jgi:tricin synthase
LPAAERGGAAAGEQQQALFDPELVAQFERAMEQLSEDEGRVLDEILEALELEAAEKNGAAAAVGRVRDGQPADVAAAALVQQV